MTLFFPLPVLPTDIEVACYGYEGIDAVKEALRAGLGCSTEAMPIKVTHRSKDVTKRFPLLTCDETMTFVFCVFSLRST